MKLKNRRDDASAPGTDEWAKMNDWFAELRDDPPGPAEPARDGLADDGPAEPARHGPRRTSPPRPRRTGPSRPRRTSPSQPRRTGPSWRPPSRAGNRRRAACRPARTGRRGQCPRRSHFPRREAAAGHYRRPAAAAGRMVRDGLLHRASRRSCGARRGRRPRPRDLGRLARRCPRPAGLPQMPADQLRLPGLPPRYPVGPGHRPRLGHSDDRRHAPPARRQRPWPASGRRDPGRPACGCLPPARTRGGTRNTLATTVPASRAPRSVTRHPLHGTVRAEEVVQGSDQRSCSLGRPVAEAVQILRRWDAQFGLDFCEAPCSWAPCRRMREAREQTSVYISASEWLWGRPKCWG